MSRRLEASRREPRPAPTDTPPPPEPAPAWLPQVRSVERWDATRYKTTWLARIARPGKDGGVESQDLGSSESKDWAEKKARTAAAIANGDITAGGWEDA